MEYSIWRKINNIVTKILLLYLPVSGSPNFVCKIKRQSLKNIFPLTQMTNIERQQETIKNSFFQFINTHIPGADLRIVDEIVLSYVISILEEASQDDCFEVEGIIFVVNCELTGAHLTHFLFYF